LDHGVAGEEPVSGRERDQVALFEQTMLPHLDAAYNLARWLTRNEHDAEDIVQEACLRAFKFFGGFRGEDSRRWLLTIVRNTFYDSIQQSRVAELSTEFDEEIHSQAGEAVDPESLLLQDADRRLVRQAVEELPLEFRETFVLRELEGLSYKEIADVAAIPLGTVMSRLARARKWLQSYLARHRKEES